SRVFVAVAFPKRFLERDDFFRRRAISLGLRNAAAAFQSLAECRQLAQALWYDLELETTGITQALLDCGLSVAAQGHAVQNNDRLAPGFREIDDVGTVLQGLQVEDGALQRHQYHGGGRER